MSTARNSVSPRHVCSTRLPVGGALLVAVSLVACGGDASNPAPPSVEMTWTQLSPEEFPYGGDYALVYDEANQEVLALDASASNFGDEGLTGWMWDGNAWSQLNDRLVPSRSAYGISYDANLEQVVVVGGEGSDGLRNDTWGLDGATWTRQLPGSPPPLRAGHAIAFDAARGRLVMFGGRYGAGNSGQTWTWDGVLSWVEQRPTKSPSPRRFHKMVYDAARAQVVLFGGEGNDGELLSDTWAWDGATWAQLAPISAPTPRRRGFALAYDAARGHVVMFGGQSAEGDTLADTWIWDGATWALAAPANSPPPKSGQTMAYDVARGNIVMFGGWDETGALSDTWIWQPVQ